MKKTTATANERTNEHDSQRQGTEREREMDGMESTRINKIMAKVRNRNSSSGNSRTSKKKKQ